MTKPLILIVDDEPQIQRFLGHALAASGYDTCFAATGQGALEAVAAQKHGLLPISQHALKFYGHLAYHDYEGIALDLEERDRLVRDLGQHDAMILRNHGLLVCGRNPAQAFDNIFTLERACDAQIAAQSGGAELVFPPESVRRHTAAQYTRDPNSPTKLLAWEAALRLIENDKPDYRS